MNIPYSSRTVEQKARPSAIGGDFIDLAVADFRARALLPRWLDAAGHPDLAEQLERLPRIGGHADVPAVVASLERVAARLGIESGRRADLGWREACRGPADAARAGRMALRLAQAAADVTPDRLWLSAKLDAEAAEAEFLARGWRL